MRLSITSALFGASAALAFPAGTTDLEDRSLPAVCHIIDVLVTALHAAPSATPFCSSFLGISTSTVYTTTTATSYSTSLVTTTTGTNTVIAPTLTVPTVTVATITAPTATFTQTASATTVTTCISSLVPKKRHFSTSTKSTKVPSSSAKTSTLSKSTAVPTPTCLSGLVPTAVSQACSCLSIPTPTSTSTITQSVFPTTVITTNIAATTTVTPLVTPFYTPVVTPSTTITVTPTSTVTFCPSPTPDTSCNNQGVQFAYYPSPFGVNTDGVYSQFDPTYFKTASPVVSGTAGSAGGISGSCPNSFSTFNFYGNTENCNNIALNYRGYLYAGQSGTFTFTISSADDIVLIWAGSFAYSGWNRANAFLDVTYPELGAGAGSGGSISASYVAVAGEYIPLRILFSQGDGPFGFNIAVTAPDGSVVLSAGSTTSEFLVQYSCDGTTAPPYAPFGQEP